MPTYVYKCVCDYMVEIEHSMNTDPEIVCDLCQSQMQRKLSTPSVRFNGAGFYSTDK